MNRADIMRLLGVAMLAATSAPGVELPVKLYSTADGLVSNRVGPVFSDSRGFLWFGTEDGLSRFDGSRFVNFGTEQGLPYPVVTWVLEVRDGIFWVATNDGIARLDATGNHAGSNSTGFVFEKFRVSPDAAANRINVLYRDRAGMLWLGTDGGVFTLHEAGGKVTFQRVQLLLAQPDLLIQTWCLLEDEEGSMWIGTKFGLVRKLPNGRTVQYSTKSNLIPGAVYGVIKDRTGVLWVAHSMGLSQFRPRSAKEVPDTSTQVPPTAAVVPTSILQDDALKPAGARTESSSLDSSREASHGSSHETTWQGGVFERPEKEGQARFLPSAHDVTGLYEFKDGRIWATTRLGGLYEFENGRYRPVNANRRVMHELSGTMAEDRDGNVWLGSQSSGAVRISPQGFVTYGQADGLGSAVTGLMEYDSSRIIVLTGARQINWFDGEKIMPTKLSAPPGREQWRWNRSLLRDHLGEWWVAGKAGLYRFAKNRDPASFLKAPPAALYTVRDGVPEDPISRLFEDSRGDVWISTFAPAHQPLTRWSRATSRFIRYSDQDGLPAFSAPTSFSEDRAGDVWITFREGGIARYHAGNDAGKDAGRFRYFTAADGFPAGPVIECYIDSADRLWCSTIEHGLLRMDRRGESRLEPVEYSTRQGLSSDLFYAMGEDLDGRMYLGSERGLDQLDPVTNHVQHFDSNDGLAAGRVVQVFRDHTGAIWLTTRTGLSRLVPSPRHTAPPAPVLISGIRIAGVEGAVSPLGVRELAIGDLAAEKNSLQIDYLRVNFAPGDPPRFQYELEGADKQWSEPTALRTVNYPRLPAGTYRFLVRVAGSDAARASAHDLTPAVVSFRILPPLWLRWWAIALAMAVIAGSFIAFERYRNARMQELGAALTESQRLTAAFKESEARFRTLAETASDAILTTSESGEIVFVNPAAERVFGHPTAAMMGRGAGEFIPDFMNQLRTEEASYAPWRAVEVIGTHAAGRDVTLEVSFAGFTREGQRYVTAVARDITERKRADEVLRRSREERIAEIERVRRRIAADLHDDIGSSLTQISILSEVVRQRMGEPESSVAGPLAYIARASSELIDSMSDIVWAINPQRDRLSELVHRIRRFAADTFTARNIAFRLDLPGPDDDLRLEGNLRRELFLIFKESINNVVRHSECSEAGIEMKLGEACLEYSIHDNGCGFDPEGTSEGHGLASMRSRAQGIGAAFELESASGKGTRIRISVLLPEQYNAS
jgi:PAS domain S-box-containing protein